MRMTDFTQGEIIDGRMTRGLLIKRPTVGLKVTAAYPEPGLKRRKWRYRSLPTVTIWTVSRFFSAHRGIPAAMVMTNRASPVSFKGVVKVFGHFSRHGFSRIFTF
jgi:hypothetical protein